MSLASANPKGVFLARLEDRARMLGRARDFFFERDILEVDTPILSKRASVDAHIDLIEAVALGERCFLHSSPEYGMKRLLSMGMGDIYQLSHVFRDEEMGSHHNPEFMMAEWYRIGFTFEEMIQETAEFCALFLNIEPTFDFLTYNQAFLKYCGFNPKEMTKERLLSYLKERGISIPSEASREELLHLCLTFLVEPHLGKMQLLALTDYPSSEAALARTRTVENEEVAMRFELYFRGVELANGYHELTDANEQKKRFLEENQERLDLGKKAFPFDTEFLEALRKGLPDCCGVAVGIDRLMMLRHRASTLEEVIPFTWEAS
ncbi:MAG: EF-P lysine aminoacylase GenX [Chlamydiia bacterium]|nr:EF-P lysine aminoacylase GenX [Chlamydiia bacterium]